MIPCSECKQDSGWSQELFESWVGNSNPEIPKCNPCFDRLAKEFDEKKDEDSVERKFAMEPLYKIIPPLYQETVVHRLPKEAKALWHSIKDWKPTSNKGIYILGNSRTGKTRTLTMLLSKIHEQGFPIKLFLAGQFNASLAEAKRSKHFVSWRDELVHIPVLAIDDLWSEKLSASSQAGLFELIEQRMANKKPTLYTTQVSTSEAVTQFDDQMRG